MASARMARPEIAGAVRRDGRLSGRDLDNDPQELDRLEWFAQAGNAARGQRLLRSRRIQGTAHENGGKFQGHDVRMLQQFQAGAARQLEIDYQAIGSAVGQLIEKFLRGGKRLGAISRGLQQPFERFPQQKVVVDDRNDLLGWVQSCAEKTYETVGSALYA